MSREALVGINGYDLEGAAVRTHARLRVLRPPRGHRQRRQDPRRRRHQHRRKHEILASDSGIGVLNVDSAMPPHLVFLGDHATEAKIFSVGQPGGPWPPRTSRMPLGRRPIVVGAVPAQRPVHARRSPSHRAGVIRAFRKGCLGVATRGVMVPTHRGHCLISWKPLYPSLPRAYREWHDAAVRTHRPAAASPGVSHLAAEIPRCPADAVRPRRARAPETTESTTKGDHHERRCQGRPPGAAGVDGPARPGPHRGLSDLIARAPAARRGSRGWARRRSSMVRRRSHITRRVLGLTHGQTQVKDAYSIAVIGGDGIGPEVVARGSRSSRR